MGDIDWKRIGKKAGLELLAMITAFFGGMVFFVTALFRMVFGMLHKHGGEKSDGPATPMKMPGWWEK